jgi:hypothetical protein
MKFDDHFKAAPGVENDIFIWSDDPKLGRIKFLISSQIQFDCLDIKHPVLADDSEKSCDAQREKIIAACERAYERDPAPVNRKVLRTSRCSVAPKLAVTGLPGPKSAPVGPPHLMKLNALLASPMTQPPPSGGEFGRLTAIYLWIALAGLRQVKESFELFEFF